LKFCTRCGKQNDDQTIFCTACGEKFLDTSSFQPRTNQIQNQVIVLTSEIGSGAHKHTPTDFYLKDSLGQVTLAARKPSLLHGNYNLVDKEELAVGYVTPKEHLGHKSLILENSAHVTDHVVQVSNIRQRGIPPKCWVEDPNGNKELTIEYTHSFFAFSGINISGSKIFDASANSGGGGIMSELNAMAHRSYTISLFDPSFSQGTLLAILIAVQPVQGI
jgi:hypothetical protein